jgi:isoleucyl-tRNA synthetase
MPFIAEELYQNLVRGMDDDAVDSVHLSRWPAVEADLIDEQLSADMALVQKVASLGHAARQAASLKVRQPLAQVVVRVRTEEEKAGLKRLEGQLLSELNVKSLTFADAASDLVDVQVHALPKQLGQKYGRGFPKIRSALAGMDQMALASRFQAGETVEFAIDGETYAVEPGDVDVRSAPRVGYSVAEEGGYLVAVTTELTPELVREGYSRELVRRIQQLRKDAGLEISDRIATYIIASPLVHQVLENYGDYVREETLTVDLVQVHPEQGQQIPDHLVQATFSLGDEEVTVALGKKTGHEFGD